MIGEESTAKKPASRLLKIIAIGAFLTYFVFNLLIGVMSSQGTPELLGFVLGPVIVCGLIIGLLFVFKKLRTERVAYTTMLVSSIFFLLGTLGDLAKRVNAVKPPTDEPTVIVTEP